MPRHDFFLELDMFDPAWQRHYVHLIDAARAANALDEYYSWLGTAEGAEYRRYLFGTVDTYSIQKARIPEQLELFPIEDCSSSYVGDEE